MKNIIMPSFVLVFICCFSMYNLNAQSKTDVEDIFKMQLFLNKKSLTKSNADTLSNISNSYRIFSSLLILPTNKLKVENELSNILETNYIFYKIKESEITYKRKISNEEYKYLDIECYPDNYYILAINIKTGISFRLAGFETNDFITFFIDFKDFYLDKKLTIKQFLKNYKVEDLDFNCMYEGLTNKKYINRTKYPCLMRCSDLLKIRM